MRGKSRAGNLCRDVADGASHGEELCETGPGGDRLNEILVGLDGIPRYRKRVCLYVTKCLEGKTFEETGWYRGFSVPFEGRFFYG